MAQALSKNSTLAFISALFLFGSMQAWAQDGVWDKDHIARAVLTTSIADREPTDDLGAEVTHPGHGNFRVQFFNQVIEQTGLTITHLWFYNNALVAEVELPIGSSNWRTYSSKLVRPSDTGNWRILVVNSEQEMLMEYNFTVISGES